MRIAVASGKGGTGKTTVATNLAWVVARAGRSVQLLDCDVEEPNCHIFLKPDIAVVEPVGLSVPQVNPDTCTGCGECARMCEYKAIICVKEQALLFPELCHGCGGCALVCPEEAITEVPRELGNVEIGQADGVAFVRGLLNVKQAMSPPVIRAVKRHIQTDALAILDAPPGTSCPVISAIHGSDYVVLVTEPTPFGLNDLDLAVKMVDALRLPKGVLINRSDVGDSRVVDYCHEHDITVLAEIPNDRRVAEAYSRGHMVCEVIPEYESLFLDLLTEITKRVGTNAGEHSPD